MGSSKHAKGAATPPSATTGQEYRFSRSSFLYSFGPLEQEISLASSSIINL
jgi:hypothetical protein